MTALNSVQMQQLQINQHLVSDTVSAVTLFIQSCFSKTLIVYKSPADVDDQIYQQQWL